MVDLTPYSSVKPLMGPLDSWLTAEDAERIMAYQVYEGIYRNVPQSFKLVQRGDEQNPIYIPSAKTIIEAKNRYLAKRWTYAMSPGVGSDGDRKALDLALQVLFRREQIWTKFATQKRYGLIRGDQVWHVVGDEEKEQGRRLSVYEVDPASYFPIFDPWNPDKIYGVHLVDPVANAAGKTVIKRQTYRKEDNGVISYELSWWESGAWDDRDDTIVLKKVGGKDIPEGDSNKPVSFDLPSEITAIPVYHIKNNRTPGQPYGNSELAGLETLIQGVNQTISDEDLTLAMQGLGLYWTNSGPPVDENGDETNWKFGPGWVLEIDAESTFGRVGGVNAVTPMLEHIGKLEQAMRESAGVPDIAIGSVDVQTAESGIALAFKMGPILAGNEEKEGEILAVTDNMLFDIVTMWMPAFEGFTTVARAVSIVDDPLPVNRVAILKEVTDMLATEPPMISVEYARTIIQEKLGYDFPLEMANAVVTEAAAIAAARNVDPFAARAAGELEEEQGGGA
jgi:hypothetical protein